MHSIVATNTTNEGAHPLKRDEIWFRLKKQKKKNLSFFVQKQKNSKL